MNLECRNSLMESIAPPTKSQPGSPNISEEKIPQAPSHSTLSFFPPNESPSGDSTSNETLPRLSCSTSSLFPPTRCQTESLGSNYEILRLFSRSISSIFPPTKSLPDSPEFNVRLIKRSSHSIRSIFLPNKSDTTSSEATSSYSMRKYSSSPSKKHLYSSIKDPSHSFQRRIIDTTSPTASFDFSELICSATNNFLAKNYTSTSSTRSWRCTLQGESAIVFQRTFCRKIEMPQLRQRISIICRSHHSSIVRLIGASASDDHIYLVYNFVDGANLANCLRNPKNPNSTVLATWISRMQIATDLAHGLDYIHNSVGSNLVHNHIKSSSIIITELSFKAKICHFGTAQLCGEIDANKAHKDKDSEIQGYMAPEFQGSGIATQKCDVYAFGVVILELLSGEEPLKYKHDKATGDVVRTSVIETAAAVFEEGDDHFGPEMRLRHWVDRRLNDSFPVDVAKNLIRLALDCVHVEPDKRPNMTSVAWKISNLYLQSKTWSDNFRLRTDLLFSLEPR
uniref:Protein kinase domain-containing protein n=1 Tax=Fagus sylvatica TaxID=28930 RepID=A0A2N9IV66_FAGSY